MSKLSEFINNEHQDNKKVHTSNESKKYTHDDLQKIIDEYSGLSEDRLMSEFLKLTLEKKRRGELSNSELEVLRNTLMPMLNNEQKIKLNQILEMVKNVI